MDTDTSLVACTLAVAQKLRLLLVVRHPGVAQRLVSIQPLPRALALVHQRVLNSMDHHYDRWMDGWMDG